MYSLSISNYTLYFQDVEVVQLPKLLGWYLEFKDFKFAKGIDEYISIEVLENMLKKSMDSARSFFVGIYLKDSKEMIGMLKGQFSEKGDRVWINSIIIDKFYQRKGYASEAIELLLQQIRQNGNTKALYLAVSENNKIGRGFWGKLSFNEIKRVRGCNTFNSVNQNMIIMYKQINIIKHKI